MPFYIRKSIKAGPLRFNLSKSGIGVSTGIPGFRVGSGPKGTYIHAGRHGLYYRETLSSSSASSHIAQSTNQNLPNEAGVSLIPTPSTNASFLVDSSSQKLLDEIKSKSKIPLIWPYALAVFSFFILILCFSESQAWFVLFSIVVLAIATYLINQYDSIRRSVVLFYGFDETTEKIFDNLLNGFKRLQNCCRIVQITAQGNIQNPYEKKTHAGATSLISIKPIKLDEQPPNFLKTNIPIPVIRGTNQKIYFFPDRLLIETAGSLGATEYEHLKIESSRSRFIENGIVPRDAKVVNYTWVYVNKNGGPDNRYKNNRQIPIIECTELSIHSENGFNMLLQLSNNDICTEFQQTLDDYIKSGNWEIIDSKHQVSE
jgi:hypothetical protein